LLDLKNNVTSIYALFIGLRGTYYYDDRAGDKFDELDEVKFISTPWLTFSFLPQFPNSIVFIHAHSDKILCAKLSEDVQIDEDTPRSVIERSKIVQIIGKHNRGIETLSVSSTGRYIAAGGEGGEIMIWRILSPDNVQLICSTDAECRASRLLDFINTGLFLTLVTGAKRSSEKEAVTIIQIDTTEQLGKASVLSFPVEPDYTLTYVKSAGPALDMLVTANEQGTVHFWELDSEDNSIRSLSYTIYLRDRYNLHEVVFFGFESPIQGDEEIMTIQDIVAMAIGDGQKGALCFYSRLDLVLEYTFDSPVVYCCIATDMDTKHLVACCQDGRGFVWPILDIINAILQSKSLQSETSSNPHFDDLDSSQEIGSVSSATLDQTNDDTYDEDMVFVPPSVTFSNVHRVEAKVEEDEDVTEPRHDIPRPYSPNNYLPSNIQQKSTVSSTKEESLPPPETINVPSKSVPKPKKRKQKPKPYNFGNPQNFINVLAEYHNSDDNTPQTSVGMVKAEGTSRLLKKELVQRMEETFDEEHALLWLDQQKESDVEGQKGDYTKTLDYEPEEKMFINLTPITADLKSQATQLEKKNKNVVVLDKKSAVPVVAQKRATPPQVTQSETDTLIASTIEANLSRQFEKQFQEDWEQEEDCAHDDFVCHMSQLQPQSQRITDTLFIKEYLVSNNMLL
jgi:WD40 repeat protein